MTSRAHGRRGIGMAWRWLLGLAVSVLFLGPQGATEFVAKLPTVEPEDGPAIAALSFTSPRGVPNPLALTEPNIAVAPDGTVYIATIGFGFVPIAPPGSPLHPTGRFGQTALWRMDPDSETFVAIDVPNDGFGGADEAIAVGPDGRIHVASLYLASPVVAGQLPTNLVRCVSEVSSDDGGATWSTIDLLACHVPRSDRPWIAVDGAGSAFVSVATGGPEAPHEVSFSLWGETPFAPAGIAQPVMGGFPGNLFVDRSAGIVYSASACQVPPPLAVCVAHSPTDAPLPVWEQSTPIRITTQIPGLKRVVGAVDDAGALYVTWLDRRNPDSSTGVYLARSADGGATWSTPVRVNGPVTAAQPWVAGAGDGNVAVAWYEADRAGSNPTSMPADTAWNVRVGVKIGGWETPASGWERATLTPTPNHFGSICLEGVSCDANANEDRSLGEFFEIAIGPDGRVHAVWSDDVVNSVQYAEQVDGPRLR